MSRHGTQECVARVRAPHLLTLSLRQAIRCRFESFPLGLCDRQMRYFAAIESGPKVVTNCIASVLPNVPRTLGPCRIS
jgi:hypothetical protein